MKMTNEERQALIGMLEGEIARYERLGMSGVDKGTSCHELDQWFRMSAYRLALAALTAEPGHHNGMMHLSHELAAARKQLADLEKQEPVEYRVIRCDGVVAAHCETLEEATATVSKWNAGWHVQPVFLQAAPPAPVKLPEPIYIEDDEPWLYRDEVIEAIEAAGGSVEDE